jgi:hypothetical protein
VAGAREQAAMPPIHKKIKGIATRPPADPGQTVEHPEKGPSHSADHGSI